MSKMLDNQGNTLVNVTTSALPSGAATGAKQDTGNASLASIDGKITAVDTGDVTVSASALPTGAATAARQDTGNTSVASIDTKTPALVSGRVPVDGSGVTQPVSAAALPLPSGAATSAKQDTAQTALDAIKTAVETIDNPIATIGGVPLTRVAVFDDAGAQITSFGGSGGAGTPNTEYARDTASTGTDKQIQAGVVRKDTRASLADTDGDRTQLQVNASGDLRVDGSAVTQPVSASSLPLPSGAATEATLAGVATDSNINSKIGSLTESAPASDTASSGLNGRLQRIAQRLTSLIALLPTALTGNNALRVEQVVAGPTQPVSGTVTANAGTGTMAVSLASVPSHAVTNAGTFAVQAAGDVAHDAADSGAPVKVGLQARSTEPTAVADADRVNAVASLLGKQIVLPHAIPASTWNYAAAAGGLVSTTGVTAKAAAGAGIRNYVKSAHIVNSHQTISTEVEIRDGSGGTVLWRGWAQAAGGGQSVNFDPPLRGTANTLIQIAEVTATATAGVLVSLQGYTAAE